MSITSIQLSYGIADNPYVAFDSSGNGVSRVFDLVWDFHALNHNNRTVSFKCVDEKYRQDIQAYIFAIMHWQKESSSSGSHVPVSSIISLRVCLAILAKRWGKSDFSLLSNEREWSEFTKKLSGVGRKTLCSQLASAINKMHKAGLLSRYVYKRDYIKWANSDRGNGQAIAIPEAIYGTILKTVVEFVETYHPYRHQISAAMNKLYTYQNKMHDAKLKELGVSVLTPSQHSSLNSKMSNETRYWPELKAIPNFSFHRGGAWLKTLLKMCFTCVGLFTAARKEEPLSMNKKSYDDSLNSIPRVSGFTTKGNNGEKILTTWNTAPIAKMALELAFDATQAARKYWLNILDHNYRKGLLSKDKYNSMLQDLKSAYVSSAIPYNCETIAHKVSLRVNFLSKGGLNLKAFNINATAEDVKEFDILNPDRAGTLKIGSSLPRLSPHDLRRSFVVFMVKKRLGNVLTVKYQLKHRNTNMSNWYANYSDLARTNQLLMDTSLMSEFDAAFEASTLDVWDEIYNESNVLSGAEGKRIAKEKAERLRQGEKTFMSRSELLSLIRTGEKSIVLLPTGCYCTNRNCERLCSLIDIVSTPCEHSVITDKAASRLSRERNNLIASFRAINDMADCANDLILEAKKKKIKSIEPTLTEHKIPFDSFDDVIKTERQ